MVCDKMFVNEEVVILNDELKRLLLDVNLHMAKTASRNWKTTYLKNYIVEGTTQGTQAICFITEGWNKLVFRKRIPICVLKEGKVQFHKDVYNLLYSLNSMGVYPIKIESKMICGSLIEVNVK